MARIDGDGGSNLLYGTADDDELYGYGGEDTFVHSDGGDLYDGDVDFYR